MTSVNYNASATAALRTLQNTNSQLETTQNRISSGFKIGEAKDNAAYWAISTTLKSDNKSLNTVKDALGLGAATVDVAYEGLNSAKDVLDEIKAKLTAATQDGVDRNVIQSEISELQKQLKSIASSSTFSGENWLSVDSNAANYTAIKNVVASFSRDANNGVTIGTIGVDTSKVSLYDNNTTTGQRGILDTAQSLLSADGRTIGIGGAKSVAGNTIVNGLNAAAGTDAGVDATYGVAVFSKSAAFTGITGFDNAGDSFAFNFSTEGGAQTVTINFADATIANGVATAGQINTLQEMANVFNKKVSTQGVEAFVNAAGDLAVRRTVPGLSATVAATSITVNDGGGTAITAVGTLEATPDVTAAQAGANAQSATLDTSNFSATATLDDDDQISFLVKVGNDDPKAVIIDKALVNDALGVLDGEITDRADYINVLNAAFSKAGVGVTAATQGGAAIRFSTTKTGSTASLSISEVTAVAGAAKLSVNDINISDAGLRAVDVISAADVSKVLKSYISVVNSAISQVTTAASTLGAVSARIDLQQEFVNKLMDTIDGGVSGLIDADMSEESTKLQALQTKQQLGVQALSIANSSAQNILRLFQ